MGLRQMTQNPKYMANSAGPAVRSQLYEGRRQLGRSMQTHAGKCAYCDVPELKEDAKDMTSLMLGFSSPEYAQRFAKAFHHAVELCGDKGL